MNDPKHYRYSPVFHSGVIDTAVMKIGDFIVDFLSELEAIFKKASNRVSGA
jgi:hypothetical protein